MKIVSYKKVDEKVAFNLLADGDAFIWREQVYMVSGHDYVFNTEKGKNFHSCHLFGSAVYSPATLVTPITHIELEA